MWAAALAQLRHLSCTCDHGLAPQFLKSGAVHDRQRRSDLPHGKH
jgi:hypothetical protein